MSAFREKTHAMFSDWTKKWAKLIWVDEATLKRLLFEQDSINLSTAQKIMEVANEKTKENWTVETFFHPEKIRWYDTERTVTYEYGGGRPVSKDEWISYYRYIFEKRIRGYGILFPLILLLIIGVVGITISYFMK